MKVKVLETNQDEIKAEDEIMDEEQKEIEEAEESYS